jgi:predicted DNA-binding protein (MmcQ/YjbR family)
VNIAEFNEYCASLPSSTNVVQWGGASVWKIGGKVFAIGWSDPFAVTFKAGDIGYEILRQEEGYMPAPYFASRGMKWIRAENSVDNQELKNHIQNSFDLIASKFSQKIRKEIGILA